MKRINPDTGKIFKEGQSREDGFIFKSYSLVLKRNGYFRELWESPKANQKKLSKSKNDKKAPFPKRLNPLTKVEFKLGDKEGNKYFYCYIKKNILSTGYRRERWLDEQQYIRLRFRMRVQLIRQRLKKSEPFNITTSYIQEIFPSDGLCPIFQTKMNFGGSEGYIDSLATLDKLIPSKGYTKGNVAWMSYKANLIKNQYSPDEVMKVAKWLKKQEKS
jgi:hypothetical protein